MEFRQKQLRIHHDCREAYKESKNMKAERDLERRLFGFIYIVQNMVTGRGKLNRWEAGDSPPGRVVRCIEWVITKVIKKEEKDKGFDIRFCKLGFVLRRKSQRGKGTSREMGFTGLLNLYGARPVKIWSPNGINASDVAEICPPIGWIKIGMWIGSPLSIFPF